MKLGQNGQKIQAKIVSNDTFQVREVLNFEWWEEERAAEGVPAQDPVVESEMDCFGDQVAK